MNVIVDKVYDKQRFAWFVHLRYGYTLPYAKTLANWIDKDYKHRLSNLTETEVRYLQATKSCRYDSEYICKLKIIPTKMPEIRKVVKLKPRKKHMKQNQFELKPFQQVLVRDDNNGPWKCGIFSHYDHGNEYPYSCIGSIYKCCIPYNENTAYLLGTTDEYVPPQPKTYHVVYENGKSHMFTDEEFKHFIETAVLNSKDVSHFAVHRL